MNTLEIANQLVALCRLGKNEESLTTLFADDAVSVEAVAMPGGSAEAKVSQRLKARVSGGGLITTFTRPF